MAEKEIRKAKEPFYFYTRLNLSELTGLKAANLDELLECLRGAPESSVYHHTHRFLQQHQYLSPEPPNDFAYWVSGVLGEKELGERLASIDTIKFSDVNGLRRAFISVIEDYLKEKPAARTRFTDKNEAFYFIKSLSFVFSTNYTACDLAEFLESLRKVTIDSIYFHVFESRLRLAKGTNDFSNWIKDSIGDSKLAADISSMDPYSYTIEELKNKVVKLIERRIG